MSRAHWGLDNSTSSLALSTYRMLKAGVVVEPDVNYQQQIISPALPASCDTRAVTSRSPLLP